MKSLFINLFHAVVDRKLFLIKAFRIHFISLENSGISVLFEVMHDALSFQLSGSYFADPNIADG